MPHETVDERAGAIPVDLRRAKPAGMAGPWPTEAAAAIGRAIDSSETPELADQVLGELATAGYDLRTIPPTGHRNGTEYELLADVVARLFMSADKVRHEPPVQQVGWLSLLVADAALLGEAMGPTWGRADLEQIAERLWMVTR